MLLRLVLFSIFFSSLGFAQTFPVPTDTLINGSIRYGFKKATHFVITPEFTEANAFAEHNALVKKDGYFMFIDERGRVVDSQKFVNARSFSEGYAAVKFLDGWGFVNPNMKKAIEPMYSEAWSFSEGFAAVKKEKWFFVNKKNVQVFHVEFDSVLSSFRNGIAIVGKKAEAWNFGVVSKTGSWVLPCEFEEVRQLSDFLVLAKKKGEDFQLFGHDSKIILSGLEKVEQLNDTLFLYEKNGFRNLFNHKGTKLSKLEFKSFADGKIVHFPKWKLVDTSLRILDTLVADSFYAIENKIVRCVNEKKQVVFPTRIDVFFQEIKAANSKTCSIKQNGKWGLMNRDGNVVLGCEYDSIVAFEANFLVEKNNIHSLLDSNYREILPLQYDWIHLTKTRALFRKVDTVGFFKLPESEMVQSVEFDSLSELGDSHFLGWEKDRASILNERLECVSEFVFNDARLVSDSQITAFDKKTLWRFDLKNDSVCAQKLSIQWAINDTLGLVRVRDTLFGVYHFRTDTMPVFKADSVWRHPNMPNRLMTKSGDTLGLASIEGRLLTNYLRNYRFIGIHENGFMKVVARKYSGFIDTNGYLLIATQYDSVKKVKDGYAAVKIRGKWGFVDRKERIVVQPLYQKVGAFSNGKAPVWVGGLSTLVNDKGEELFKPRFNAIFPTKAGHWLTYKNKLYGFLYQDGLEAFNPKFERVEETDFGYYVFRQYGKEGILNGKLEAVLPFSEQEIHWVKGSRFFAIKR